MLVDGNFDAVVVATSALAERARAPHEHAAAVAQLAAKCLDHACTGLAHDVRGGRQYWRVGAPGVGEVARVAAVAPGQRPPQAYERGRAARAQRPSHDAPRGPFHGQPEPYFVAPAAHKGPHLIEFERLPLLFLRLFRPQAGQSRRWPLRFFLPVGQWCCALRPSGARCRAATRARATAGPPGRSAAPAQ